MSDTSNMVTSITKNINQLTVQEPLNNNALNSETPECETAEDALTTDSDDYLSEPLRFSNFHCSTSSQTSIINSHSMAIPEENDNYYSFNSDINFNNIQIPIVGYEIMEERARFTVYKLRIENKITGDCWYVFRRYTDFVRLCNRFRNTHPKIIQLLPRKRWLKNNFDPIFLEERVNGLQILVNTILSEPELASSQEIQDFFCLNEPPTCSDSNEESRAMFEALEETINDLKLQIKEKETKVDSLQDALHEKTLENENLLKIIRNTVMNCQKCQKECENLTKILK